MHRTRLDTLFDGTERVDTLLVLGRSGTGTTHRIRSGPMTFEVDSAHDPRGLCDSARIGDLAARKALLKEVASGRANLFLEDRRVDSLRIVRDMGGGHSYLECVETIQAGDRALLFRSLGPQAYCGDTTQWWRRQDSL